MCTNNLKTILMGILIIGDFMKVRLGYVSISKALTNVTSSHSISYTNYIKNNCDINKVYYQIEKNLIDLNKIITYNIKNNIHFYRLSANLIPLATHEKVSFDYIENFQDHYKNIRKKIKESKMRVDIHTDQYTIINSTNKDVLTNAIKSLDHQYKVLSLLGASKTLIVHIGSNTFGKENSLTRFINNFNKLPDYLKKAIAIENDDKIFNILDTLDLCKKLNTSCVLDYHHHICNGKDNIDIKKYYQEIFATWKSKNPKIHFSSPKNNTKKDIRSHNDYIDLDSFIDFIEEVKIYKTDIDIMIEAKEKDDAMFRLIRGLKYKTNYKFIDDTTFEVN